jgi:hypothetical protein
MKIFKLKKYLLLTFTVFLALASVQKIDGENLPAFPGAEGFGRYTTGGRGGAVYHVTSTADDGSEGTLRWALNKAGKRTIVFNVSGTIHLKSALAISSGNVTLSGQTAPGDGICVADFPFTINASNVIIRFMRFRLGNLKVDYHEGDGLGGMDQENIMVDHCSISWSIDECCSVYGMRNMTVQWCIVSQSLQNSGHSKGAHGYGGNWGGSGASYHHNLMCHNNSRTPRLGPRASTQTDERMDMRNNVIYNWGGEGCYGGEGMNVNIVNNYYKPGPGTKQRSTSLQYRIAGIGIRTTAYCTKYPAFLPMLHRWGKYFVDGNYMNGFSNVTADNWTKGIYEQISNESNDNLFTQTTKDTIKLSDPIDYILTTTHDAATAYSRVLNYSGASLSRDWVDSLMVYDTRYGKASYTGTGNIYGIINSQEDNKPAGAGSEWNAWPNLKTTVKPQDTDKDGMPDNWETQHNLNPNDPSDGNKTDTSGYTMLEVYMNGLISEIINSGNEGGTATGRIIDTTTPVSNRIVLSSKTYNGAASAQSPWTFEGGYSITNNNSKAYATGSEYGIKYSSDVQFTINLPASIKTDTIRFTGYDNYSDADSYLKELNGQIFGNTEYVYTKKDASGNYKICEYTIALAKPATGSLTFMFSGKQVVMTITLSTSSATGLNTIFKSDANDKQTDVYSIDGRLIRSNVEITKATDGLKKGIYIVGNKKISVFR